MTTPSPDRPGSPSNISIHWIIGLGLGITATAFAIYGMLSRFVFNPDPFIYAQAIKQLFAGERLYAGAWQDRPPLGLLFYAPPQILAPRSYLAMELFLAGWLVVEGFLFAWLARRRPWVALGVYAFVVLCPATYWDFFWPSTEHAANLFVALLLLAAFVVTRDNRSDWRIAVLTGAATTMAFHARQSALLFCLVPLVALARARQSWRDRAAIVGMTVGAGVATWALLVVSLAPFTDLAGYWHITFRYPFLFAQQDMNQTRWQLTEPILMTPLCVLGTFFFTLAVSGRHRLLAITATAAGLIATLASPRAHTHYWAQMLPVIALLILLANERNRRWDRKITVACLAAMGVAAVAGVSQFLDTAFNASEGGLFREVAGALDRAAQPGDTVFVLGPMPSDYILFASAVPPAHRFYCPWQLNRPRADLLPEPLEQIFRDYATHPPSLLVVERHYLEAIQKLPIQLPQEIQLIQMLVTRYAYRVLLDDVRGFVLLRRVGTRRTPSATELAPRVAPAR